MKRLPLAAFFALLAVVPAAADSLTDANAQLGAVQFKKSDGAAKPGGAASSVPAKKLDLGDLLRGPSLTVVPDVDASANDPKVKVFLAAVDYIAGDGLALAKAGFGKYMERPGSAGGTEPPGDQDFEAARRTIRALVLAPSSAARRIAVGQTGARSGGGSAGWGLAPYSQGDPFPGGDIDFANPPREKINQSGPGDRNFYRLKDIDFWANGVLHEAVHVYYDYFTFSKFKGKTTSDEPPICFGQSVFWTGGSPASVCGGASSSCPQPYRTMNDPVSKTGKACYRPCGDITCYSWGIPGKDSTGPTEILARVLSLDMTETSRGEALKKIVDAAR